MSFKKKKVIKKDELFKYYSNITGLSNKTEKIQNNKSVKNVKLLGNEFKKYNFNKKKELIKILLNKPQIKLPYDGFAIQNNKCTIESLLQKSFQKEEISIVENNKLCKNNYPLIKFLSNKKTKNNTKKLLIEILCTEYGELTKAQENMIKYGKYKKKYFNKSINNKSVLKNKNVNEKLVIPQIIGNTNQINNIRNNLINKDQIKEKYLTPRFYKNSEYKNKRKKQFRKNLQIRFINNNRPDTQRIYSNLGFGETVRLDNHEASRINNEILLNRIVRKKYLNSKNNEPDYLDNEIINDASKLKFNNNLMLLNTKILTI